VRKYRFFPFWGAWYNLPARPEDRVLLAPAPYLTGDMPSSVAAVNAIVEDSGHTAVVGGSGLFAHPKATARPG